MGRAECLEEVLGVQLPMGGWTSRGRWPGARAPEPCAALGPTRRLLSRREVLESKDKAGLFSPARASRRFLALRRGEGGHGPTLPIQDRREEPLEAKRGRPLEASKGSLLRQREKPPEAKGGSEKNKDEP